MTIQVSPTSSPVISQIERQLEELEAKKSQLEVIVNFNSDLQGSTLVNRTLQGPQGRGLEVSPNQLQLMEELGLSARVIANFNKESVDKLQSRAIRAQVELGSVTQRQTTLLVELGKQQAVQVQQVPQVTQRTAPEAPMIWILDDNRNPIPHGTNASRLVHTDLVNLEDGRGWITASEAGLVKAPPAPPPAPAETATEADSTDTEG